jgi:hypothetical protein
MFGKNLNESKFYTGRNYEETKIKECFLSFGAESFVIQFAIQRYKD